jgi:carbonic anhydrase
MSVIDELVQNNKRYAAGFDKGDLPAPPSKGVAIVACMDARFHDRALGLEEGEAHIIRNAGGVITDDEIRSLAISQHELGTTEIMLIHHTGCGLLTFTDEEFKDKLEQASGERPAWSSEAFEDLEGSLRNSIERIRSSPFIPHKDVVRGFVYEVETGALREVQ